MKKTILALVLAAGLTSFAGNAIGMVITVRTLTGTTRNFDVEPSDSIEVVKEKIKPWFGVPPDYARLIFKGKTLENNWLLSDTSIDKDATLHLVMPSFFYAADYVPGSGIHTLNTGYSIRVIDSNSTIEILQPIVIPDSLTISTSETNPKVFSIFSYSESSSLLSNFNPSENFLLPFLTAEDGISNFDSTNFLVDVSNFEEDLLGGTFSIIQQDANTLALQFTAVPEPSQGAASLLLVAGIAGFVIVRHRKALVA